MQGKHAIAYVALTKCKKKKKGPFKWGIHFLRKYNQIWLDLRDTQNTAPCTAVVCSVTEPVGIPGKGQCTNSMPSFWRRTSPHPRLPVSSFFIPLQKQGFFCRRNTGKTRLCPNAKPLISSLQHVPWDPGISVILHPLAGMELIFFQVLWFGFNTRIMLLTDVLVVAKHCLH